MSPFVTKLVDSQLQAATGYSSGSAEAFRVSEGFAESQRCLPKLQASCSPS